MYLVGDFTDTINGLLFGFPKVVGGRAMNLQFTKKKKMKLLTIFKRFTQNSTTYIQFGM